MAKESALVIPRFYIHTVPNPVKSKEAGRPIFDDMEVVEVRFAADRQTIGVYPANAQCGQMEDEFGNFRPMTYAERWPEQYRRFKANQQQIAEGTPVDELPFLTQSKRAELRALGVFTAEALAALDGQPLKNLGQGGRELKNQAQAYLDAASGTANVTKMAAQIAELQERIRELTSESAPVTGASKFASWTADQIKDWIEEKLGERPRGNPSLSTLIKRAEEVEASLAEEQVAA